MDGVSIVIKKDGKYLLIQQAAAKPLPFRWFNVSGAMEAGETLEEAAVREVKEETGLEIDLLRETIALKSDWKTEKTHFFIANWKSGKVKPDAREINSCGWFTYEEILKLELMPATRIFFEKHFKPF